MSEITTESLVDRVSSLLERATSATPNTRADIFAAIAEAVEGAEDLLQAERQPFSGEIVWAITRADLDEIVGRKLTTEEQDRFADCIPNSSIPDALATIAEQFLHDPEDECSVCARW